MQVKHHPSYWVFLWIVDAIPLVFLLGIYHVIRSRHRMLGYVHVIPSQLHSIATNLHSNVDGAGLLLPSSGMSNSRISFIHSVSQSAQSELHIKDSSVIAKGSCISALESTRETSSGTTSTAKAMSNSWRGRTRVEHPPGPPQHHQPLYPCRRSPQPRG